MKGAQKSVRSPDADKVLRQTHRITLRVGVGEEKVESEDDLGQLMVKSVGRGSVKHTLQAQAVRTLTTSRIP
jgi:hypothetical protein